jgi:hypothetical protein
MKYCNLIGLVVYLDARIEIGLKLSIPLFKTNNIEVSSSPFSGISWSPVVSLSATGTPSIRRFLPNFELVII